MLIDRLLGELNAAEHFFQTSTDCLTEAHGDFRATPESMTVAQQVGHVAITVDWFIEGAFDPKGFCLDFAREHAKVQAVKTLSQARTMLEESFSKARAALAGANEEFLNSALPEGEVMGGAPRWTIVGGITDHTAHHRGALTVYARLLGLTPRMPYA